MTKTHRTKTRKLLLAIVSVVIVAYAGPRVRADVRLPSIFGDHMVLQRGKPIVVWGTADADEKITVTLCEKSQTVAANAAGKWKVKLDALKVGGPHTLTIKGKNIVAFEDVLIGEVWLCSGQSNMAWSVDRANDADLEIAAADYPNIRIISVPQVGTQEPQSDFRGQWQKCTPETVGTFSAVGYFFGRQLHRVLNVPVGLIDNAWGGSSAEAWVRRDLLEADARYKPLLERWAEIEKKPAAGDKKRRRNPLKGQHRPANLYCGVLNPIIGYGIQGAIWYQGESNANRAYQYRHLFPLMIQNWRDDWGQGDFPFYWLQLADFRNEQPTPAESAWAELREAQTMTLSKLPNTGEAVIIDIGEGRDIHPRNKQGVGRRLARWALARDYGRDIPYRSPTYKSMKTQGNKIVVAFDHIGSGLYAFDVREPVGFAIAGDDKKFVWAKAKITGKNQVEVWSDNVPDPVAVRYAWADNPVCNLRSRDGLPATPFRTDAWPGVTINNHR